MILYDGAFFARRAGVRRAMSLLSKNRPGCVDSRSWEEILVHVTQHQPLLVRGWFAQLSPERLDHGVLRVCAPTSSQLSYLEEHCARAFANAATAVTGHLVSVQFAPAGAPDSPRPAPPKESLSFESEFLRLNGEYTFDNFVVGPCNRLAHAASLAVSESPGWAYNPLFVHGSVGLGKSHLLQAICHTIVNGCQPSRVLYINGEDFTNHFLEAVEFGALHSFRNRYRHVDLLVIDDIQFLAERERSQDEFFHTFNTLYQQKKQIVLASDAPPNEIPSLEERLVSRFNWGLVAGIDKPCLETRMAIIRKKARVRCIELSDEVVHLIASRVDSNTRVLEGVITKLDLMSRSQDGVIDAELTTKALGDLPGRPPGSTTLPQITELVALHYVADIGELLGPRRLKSIVLPRQVAMYLARQLTSLSLKEIGQYFSRDHTTVMHALETVDREAARNPAMARDVAQLRATLERSHGNGTSA